MSDVVLETSLSGLPRFISGKVRDVYELPRQERLLIVATDRISAYDHILPTGIPGKGRLLTRMSAFWFDFTREIVPNHVISTDAGDIAPAVDAEGGSSSAGLLHGRSMLVHRAKVFPVECVVRGYITGSAWSEYRASGTVCGHRLPAGLREADRLPEPLFTPATKAKSGHDENIPVERFREIVGATWADAIIAASLAVYRAAHDHAAARGILIADTKMEFGLRDGQLILVDELLTPDSSRFWEASTWQPGGTPDSYDKQFVRDYLISVGYDKESTPPPLPEEIAARTAAKYEEVFTRLTRA